MINETVEKLFSMRLRTMASAFRAQLAHPNLEGLSFEERFGMLVDQEWIARENKKLSRRIKGARLKHMATIEDIDFRYPRELEKTIVLSLATCQWIRSHHNVIITGGTGLGKTYLGEAFGNKACREGFTAVCYRQNELFEALTQARALGTLSRVRDNFRKTDLLVIDDFVISPLSESERRDMLDIMEDRHGIRSTLLTSQYPIGLWHGRVGDPTMADAILDRIVHNAHKIALKGDSMRKILFDITENEL